MKHTPGPWTIRFMNRENIEDGFFIQAPRLKPTHPYDIEILGEDTGGDMYTKEQRYADAVLTVQAPNMLALLKKISTQLDEYQKGNHNAPSFVGLLSEVDELITEAENTTPPPVEPNPEDIINQDNYYDKII